MCAFLNQNGEVPANMKMLMGYADFCVFLSKALAIPCQLPKSLSFPEKSYDIFMYSKHDFFRVMEITGQGNVPAL